MKNLKDTFITKYPIAHRGLWDETYPENTKTAFIKAIENGYAIETDVQMTIDGVLVIEHDDNLKRLFNLDRDIRDLTYEEVKTLHPMGKEDGVMTFDEFLELVDGRVPLIIEVKPPKNKGAEEKIVERLKAYKGEFAVQSFNPNVMKKITKLAPEFIAGMLCSMEPWKHVPWIVRKYLHSLVFTLFTPFDYMAVRVQDLEKYAKKVKKYTVLSWTIKTDEDVKKAELYADNIIFEKTVHTLGKFGEKKW